MGTAMEHRTDVTELIPKALGNYWLIFFGGAGVVAVLECAYRQLPSWSGKFGEASLALLDVTSPGSVLAWCQSALFLLSAGVSLLNSRLGRKYDDPAKGDVWFWTAFALILLSLDTQVQFRNTLRAVLIYATGTPLHQDGTVWWLTVYSFVFGLIAIRLLQDMWAYLPAFLVFSLSILGAIAAQLISISVIRVSSEAVDIVVLRTALEAFAVLLLFLSFLLFGRRQVLRDPQVALAWFAKVWNQSVPAPKTVKTVMDTPTVKVVAPPSPALNTEPASDAAIGIDVKQVRGLPNSRPELRKTGDDDFALLNAS